MKSLDQFLGESEVKLKKAKQLEGGYSLQHVGTSDMGNETHHLYHGNGHVATLSQYNGYIDKKRPGSRIVDSRKEAKLWSIDMQKGHYTNPYYDRTSYKYKSKNHALDTALHAHDEKGYFERKFKR